MAIGDKLVSADGLKAVHDYDAERVDGLVSAVNELQTGLLNAYPTDSASGSIANFPDGAGDVPIKALNVEIEPVQDLHGYDNPWPAGGGKNLLPMSLANMKTINTTGEWNGNAYTLLGVTFTVNVDDGGNVISIATNGTATGYSLLRLVNSLTITEKSILNGSPQSTYSGAKIQADSTPNYQDIGNGATIPANTELTRVIVAVPQGVDASGKVFKPMIRLSSVTDATFQPYSNICPISGWTGAKVYRSGANTSNPTEYTVTFPSDPGTVYGGTLDVVSGVLRVTDGYIESYNGETLPGKWISDRDVYAAGTLPTTGAQVVYELATPLTYNLTPTEIKTLVGTNNVWSDAGDVGVTYRADIALYIQKMTGSAENDMIADSPIASGKYFLVGNTLYLSTAAIAAGAKLTPGTNCVQTTLADALNALNN